MATIATDSKTLTVTVDVASVTTWYRLQASTSAAPARPTVATPTGWTTTEPGYDGTTTSTLYTCQKTTLTDGTYSWSDVCISSSYEAAKQAANAALAASAAVSELSQHFWYDSDGAHVSTEEGVAAGTQNSLWTSAGIYFRKAANRVAGILTGNSPSLDIYDGAGNTDGNIVARFASDLIELGRNSTSAIVRLCAGSLALGFGDLDDYTGAGGFSDVGYVDGGTSPVMVHSQESAALYGFKDEGLGYGMAEATPAGAAIRYQSSTAVFEVSVDSNSIDLSADNGTNVATADMTASGLRLGGTGGRARSFNFGSGDAVTNSNGVTSFNPSLGVVPSSVVVVHRKATNETEAVAKIAVPMVWSVSATQVQVRWQRTDTGAWLTNNRVGWYWIAIA